MEALSYVLPHGEEADYTRRALAHVEPFVGLPLEDTPAMVR